MEILITFFECFVRVKKNIAGWWVERKTGIVVETETVFEFSDDIFTILCVIIHRVTVTSLKLFPLLFLLCCSS